MHICNVSVGSDNACCRLEDIRKIKLLCQMESFALSGSLVLLYLEQFVYQCVTGVILCCRRRKQQNFGRLLHSLSPEVKSLLVGLTTSIIIYHRRWCVCSARLSLVAMWGHTLFCDITKVTTKRLHFAISRLNWAHMKCMHALVMYMIHDRMQCSSSEQCIFPHIAWLPYFSVSISVFREPSESDDKTDHFCSA